MFGLFNQGGTTFAPQQQQVINPRAQYERQSALVDLLGELLAAPNQGGWAGAIASAIDGHNFYKTNKAAESSLSEALRLEQEKEAQAAAEAKRIRDEDFQRGLAEIRAAAEARAAADARNRPPQLTPEQELENELTLYRRKAEIDAELRPREPRQPTQQELAFQRIDQLVERGELTQQQGERAKNNFFNIDATDPNAPKEDGAPTDATTRTTLGKLNQAEQALNEFVQAAFDMDNWDGQGAPDYREITGRLGVDRGAILDNAIQNLLYAKSGAAATEQEVQNMRKQFGPGLLSTDSANWDRIQRMFRDIQTQREALLGRGDQGAVRAAPQQRPGSANISPETARLLERY